MKMRKGAILAAGLLAGALLVCPTAQAAAANPSAELNQRTLIAYADVLESHWAAADIQYVTERGLFQGTSDTTFAPGANMNRAMLATVLYRYAGNPAVTGATPYWDAESGQWYTDAVTWAYQSRIFTQQQLNAQGLSPTEEVSRAEFAIMLYNFAKSQGKAACDTGSMENHPFTDMDFNTFSFSGYGPIYNEAKEAMLGWAWPNGIITGSSATTINPTGRITRAEVAAMLSRFDKNVLGGTTPTVTIQPTPDPEPSPDSESKYDGYTLTNGKPLSEENVYEILMGLKEIYPTGTVYETPYRSTSAARGPYSRGTACAGWAMLCSDAVFGDLPWLRVNTPSWSEIHVGDFIEFDNEYGGHVVVVLKKVEDYILVTESGTNNKALWGGQYFRWWLEEQSGYTLYTRYPE